MIGQTISHYKILSKLGEGGMGVVYKAEDSKLKRQVALKFLPAHLLGSSDVRARFEREAQAAAALHHPNICPVFEIDEVDGKSFIAMAFIEGQSLDKKIAKRKPPPLSTIPTSAPSLRSTKSTANRSSRWHSSKANRSTRKLPKAP